MQEIILIRGKNLTYAKEHPNFLKRLLNKTNGLILKEVSFTLYKGEVLGILSDYKTLYYFKEVVNGTIDLKEGKVRKSSPLLSLDVMDHIHYPGNINHFLYNILNEFVSGKDIEKTLNNLTHRANIKRLNNVSISSLSRNEIAKILLEIASIIEVESVLFCNFYRFLNSEDIPKFYALIESLEKEKKGILLLESDVTPIQRLANYFVWLSYGQVRYDGSVKRGLDVYQSYLKQKSKIKSVEEERAFDREYKENISDYAVYQHGLQRIQKNQLSIFDSLQIKKIIISFILLFVMSIFSFFIVTDMFDSEIEERNEEVTQAVVQEETPSLHYGIVLQSNIEIGNESFQYLDLISASLNDDNITGHFNEDAEVFSNNEVLYFNPASLFEVSTLNQLLPYTHESFKDNYIFYTNYLTLSKDELLSQLAFESTNSRQSKLRGVPITFHFDGQDVYGMSFPSVNDSELLEDYNITTHYPIFRIDSGFMILDTTNKHWLYINK